MAFNRLVLCLTIPISILLIYSTVGLYTTTSTCPIVDCNNPVGVPPLSPSLLNPESLHTQAREECTPAECPECPLAPECPQQQQPQQQLECPQQQEEVDCPQCQECKECPTQAPCPTYKPFILSEANLENICPPKICPDCLSDAQIAKFDPSKSKSTGLIVMGMHRSGTSMFTGLISECLGVFSGRTHAMLAPSNSNEKGFYERLDLLSINMIMLNKQSFSRPHLISNCSLMSDSLMWNNDLSARQAKQLMLEDLNEHPVWIIKDPRLCLTYDYYRRDIPDPVFLLPIRHPTEVARSLSKRNRMASGLAYEMWYIYIMNSIRLSIGYKRLFVLHSDIIADPTAFTLGIKKRLSNLGVPLKNIPEEDIAKCAEAWVDPSLLTASKAHKPSYVQRSKRSIDDDDFAKEDDERILSSARRTLLQFGSDAGVIPDSNNQNENQNENQDQNQNQNTPLTHDQTDRADHNQKDESTMSEKDKANLEAIMNRLAMLEEENTKLQQEKALGDEIDQNGLGEGVEMVGDTERDKTEKRPSAYSKYKRPVSNTGVAPPRYEKQKYDGLWAAILSREAEQWTLKDLPYPYNKPPLQCDITYNK